MIAQTSFAAGSSPGSATLGPNASRSSAPLTSNQTSTSGLSDGAKVCVGVGVGVGFGCLLIGVSLGLFRRRRSRRVESQLPPEVRQAYDDPAGAGGTSMPKHGGAKTDRTMAGALSTEGVLELHEDSKPGELDVGVQRRELAKSEPVELPSSPS